VLVFFQNNELEELAFQRIDSVEDIYRSVVAEKLVNLKVSIAKELKQNGIQTLLTRPEDLNITTINKYLELKAKGVI
jgi:N-acetylmuramoyl-L-alanine amidase